MEFLCLLWQHCRRPWSFTCEPARLTVVEPVLFEWDVFEMATPIQSPAKCEMRFVIGFLKAKVNVQRKFTNRLLLFWFPSDFHLFLHLKKLLAGKNFDDDDEVQEEVMTWFKVQAADFYDSGIKKLVPRLNTRSGNAGDCVEEQSYAQASHSHCRFCKFKMLCMFKTFVSLLSGHPLYILYFDISRRSEIIS